MMTGSDGRASVSVIMPCAGDDRAAERAIGALLRIDHRPEDELILVDNSIDGAAAVHGGDDGRVRVLRAGEQRSSYYARNVGAAAARNQWLLFLDSDCSPHPRILDLYLAEQPAEDEGALAGEILADPAQRHVLARYQADREYLSQRRHVSARRPYAVTANLLVRSSAWRSVGGFLEGIRSGGDSEFAWRLQDAGWRLGYRPEASVVHSHRDSARSFARVILRYAAGRAWLNRRYPGSYGRPASIAGALRAVVSA